MFKGKIEIMGFNYGDKEVRTVLINNDPWWIAKDICDALEIGNSRQALARLDDDEKDVISTDTPGGIQEMQAVNETGLYNLILGSRKPEAKEFKRWITHEVIPSIRKHGMYATDEMLDKLVESPDLVISIATKLKEEKAARIAAEEAKKLLEDKVREDAPKVEFYDHAVENSGLFNITTTAKIVGIGRDTMCKALRDMDILFWQKYNGQNINVPFQTQIDQKHCFLKMRPKKWGSIMEPIPQTYFTVKGIEYIRRKLKERGIIKEDVAC